MRILFTIAGGNGHLQPLLPIARAAVEAGHVVAFTCRPLMAPKVQALGYSAFMSGSDVGLTPKRVPLVRANLDQDLKSVGTGFARRIGRERAADILPLCAVWQPDVLVCEEMDFGAMVVAENLELPHATVLVLAAGTFVRPEAVAAPLDQVRADYGLPPDPNLDMLSRYLVLSPFPPTLRDPAAPLSAPSHAFRLFADDELDNTAAPAWLTDLNDTPLVYFTLGTVFNVESGDLFQRVLQGLRDLPINLVVTVGNDLDPAELGAQPPNVRIERYIRQEVLLPHCALVISHAGSGSVVGALAHGLPMVLIPLGADQPLNAARCEQLGVAQVLDSVDATPLQVRAAVESLLRDPSYRRAAEKLRDEYAALPGPAYALSLIEPLLPHATH